jgi:hypothetical protein
MTDDPQGLTPLQSGLQSALAAIVGLPLMIIYTLGGPATYALLVIRTWQSHMSLGWKIFYWLTIDMLLAAFWPGLWLWWGAKCLFGYCSTTPLILFFG